MVTKILFSSEEIENQFHSVIKNGVLFMPSISCGNVDQMALDLVIFSGIQLNRIQRVGSIYCSNLQAIVGVSAFGDDVNENTCPTTGIELYMMKDAPNAFLQVRSQPKDGYAEQFVEDLLSLLQSWQVNSIVVFSAADSTFYDSSQMNGTLAYYTTSNSVLDKIQDQVPSINITQEDVNGSGLLPLLQKSLIEASIPFTTFIAFITEGQNFGDAIQYTVWNGCSDSFIMGNGGSIIE
ncbi:hypothetical protein WA171_003946 [Blastocystis sp. BT1]